MDTIRKILFIPIAIIIAIVAGVLGFTFGQITVSFFAIDPELGLPYGASGLFSAIALVIAGLKIHPNPSKKIKNILSITVIVLGIVSTTGSFLSGDVSILSGIAMILGGIGTYRMDLTDFQAFSIYEIKNKDQ